MSGPFGDDQGTGEPPQEEGGGWRRGAWQGGHSPELPRSPDVSPQPLPPADETAAQPGYDEQATDEYGYDDERAPAGPARVVNEPVPAHAGAVAGEHEAGEHFEYHATDLDLLGEPDSDEWSIRCLDVHKRLGGVEVLNGLNVAFPENTITVVLGPSGTGKSVLIKHLIGLMFPDAGDIVVLGEHVPTLTMPQLLSLRRRIGVLFQDGALFGSMSVFDNVAFPLRQHTDLSESQIAERVEQRLIDVGLGDAMDLPPSQLSGGMRKRAGFARALVTEPDVVIFDEPDSGLDPVRTALLCELIQEMHGIYRGTYIVVTHDIASARRIGEYIALLWRGRIVEAGDAERMFSSENPFVRQFLSGSAEGPLTMD
jgi:phospholipid/cholesterol/gamma-HCH transport system ATP-binding protein